MGSSLRIRFLLGDEFSIRRVIQRDESGPAQPLLAADNQAAVLQFSKNPRGALAAAVELGLCLFHCEVQPDGAVRLDIAVLPGDAGPIQQERVEHFCVIADLPERFVLQQKPRKRHIGCRWAVSGKLTEYFHLTSYPIHPIRRIDWIDG